MKRLFIVRTLLFLLPLIVFTISMEMFVRTVPNSYSYKKKWMDEHSGSVETLILGNSHMYSAIDPSMMRNAFNLSNSAQNLEMDCWLLAKYIDICPKLKTVLVNIDDMNLFSSDYEDDERIWNRAVYYNLYMDYPKHGFLSRYHYEMSCPLFAFQKIEKQIFSILGGYPYDILCDSLGRGTYYSKRNRKERDFRFNKDYLPLRTTNKHSDALAKNTEYLSMIARDCKKRQIRLIIISTPYWHLYNMYKNKDEKKMIKDIAKKIANRYNMEYGDFWDDTRIARNSLFFVDRHHLSDDGSYYFTQLIKKTFCIQ